MTQKKDNATAADWRDIFASGPDGLRQLVQQIVQEVLEAEMDETVGSYVWPAVSRRSSRPHRPEELGPSVPNSRTTSWRSVRICARTLTSPRCGPWRSTCAAPTARRPGEEPGIEERRRESVRNPITKLREAVVVGRWNRSGKWE